VTAQLGQQLFPDKVVYSTWTRIYLKDLDSEVKERAALTLDPGYHLAIIDAGLYSEDENEYWTTFGDVAEALESAIGKQEQEQEQNEIHN
tara:strand:- start:18067 stop:18336 length:270 start_codon:yes stop_codon:yes gene_type:complete